jgi:hypothetical protein
MPLPKRPVHSLDDINQRRRDRETLNLVLGHEFDDSRVQTPAEVAAGVTPVNKAYEPGQLLRQGDNPVPGTTDMSAAFQRAVDAASAQHPSVFFDAQCGISKPILIRTTTQQAIGFVGTGKSAARLEPLAADIKVAAQNINCCIFNQNNNPHLRLENFEFFSVAAFSGVGVYCVEGGGADGSGQALFSPVIQEIFFNFPSTNGGFLTGAIQNAHVTNNTFEGSKGAFQIVGVGHSDVHYTNNSLYNCYDHFILQTADTQGAFDIHIEGLNAYVHNRGRLIDVQNWNGATISGVVLEPAVSNLGNVGMFKFKNCQNIVVSNFVSVTRTDVPPADVAIEVEGTSAKFSTGKICADIGFRISGTGAIDIELDNVDFTGCLTACIQFNGNASGVLRTRNCKFNDSELSSILSSVSNAVTWISENDEFVNAGMSASAGSRNITLGTSGRVVLSHPRIGQNHADADAAFYIDAAGSGDVEIVFPEIVGTPPTGIKTGAQSVKFIYKPLVGSATYDPPSLADATGATTTVTVSGAALGDFSNVSFSLDLQGISVTSYVSGADTVSVRFQNESGGLLDLASGTLLATTQRIHLV